MKHIFPSLKCTIHSFLAIMGLLALLAARTAAADSAGNQLVREAAQCVHSERALSAEVRCRIDAFGHELVGEGSYRQLGQGVEKLLRLDLKIQIADQAIARMEVCGPQYYWVRRESPYAAASLGRVNLRQLRQAIARNPDALAQSPGDTWILLGGLPKLLESLQENFDFDAPQQDELQFKSAGGDAVERLPVLKIQGRWKPDRLAELMEGSKRKDKEPAEQLPDAVELVLGRPDQILPLFPYRVTYLRDEKGDAGQGGASMLRPMLTMELFNVHRKEDIDPREFEYNPAGQEVADLTPSYLQRMGVGTKQR